MTRKGCGKGCLVGLLCGIGMLVFTGRQIAEPMKRGTGVHQAIRPGMTVAEVEGLLHGRTMCFYDVRSGGDWTSLKRAEFMERLAAPEGLPDSLRLQLTFMGMTPYRVSFEVYLDPQGAVTNTSQPYGWD